MAKQETRERVKKETKDPLMYRVGPFSGKTCYIDRADRIKVKVELGFRASLVVEVKLKNLDMAGLTPDDFSNIKSCLVVLIGGHAMVIDQVDEPWDGVHAARVFIPCARPPEETLHRKMFGDKMYVDLGDYLERIGRPVSFDPDTVKRDYLNRR